MEATKYFEDFLSIPRESGKEEKIAGYLIEFAKKHNLEYYTDDIHNVIIKKKSNHNSVETIILQGHIDMVCNSIGYYDFDNNGIDWFIEDGFYKTHGTTLGADNGVGCSIILSILANDDIQIPNIEAVFTVQEETTMLGAKKLDYSLLNGKNIISLDGTEENKIEVSSAGMQQINISNNIEYVLNDEETYEIKISGLPGGHSGVDIDKNKGNAIKLMGEILKSLDNYNLVSINGGVKDNVIPSECVCIISTNFEINVDNFLNNDFPSLKIDVNRVDKCAKVINKADSDKIIDFINNLQIEVLSYIDNFPQTSLNLATISTLDDSIEITISIRSSNNKDEKKWIEEVEKLSSNMRFTLGSSIPYFTYKENSYIRDLLVKKYYELTGENVRFEHVHAGLEGGVFCRKIDDADICVIAANLYDIHTPNEMADIESINRVYNWVVSALECI
jgi:dipeptidase D